MVLDFYVLIEFCRCLNLVCLARKTYIVCFFFLNLFFQAWSEGWLIRSEMVHVWIKDMKGKTSFIQGGPRVKWEFMNN